MALDLVKEYDQYSKLDQDSKPVKVYSKTDVAVDPPGKETLFDHCEWRSFMSARYALIRKCSQAFW